MKIFVPDCEFDRFHLLKTIWPRRFRVLTYNPSTCTTQVEVLGPAQTLVALKYPNWIGKTL